MSFSHTCLVKPFVRHLSIVVTFSYSLNVRFTSDLRTQTKRINHENRSKMIVNKKLDRFKQWAGERMGGEVKTNTTDNFKALEQEMDLRHQGMEKMQQSMSIYMKAVSKKAELEKKEKTLPIAYLGSTMITHADDFEHDAQYGQCLSSKISNRSQPSLRLTILSFR